MKRTRTIAHAGLLALMAVATVATAPAVELSDLKGLEDIFGRYAPGGDCKRQPQVLVEQGGLTIERSGTTEKLAKVEFAASYNGDSYDGIMKVIFPYTNPTGDGYPIIMYFNWNEKPGALEIQGQDQGYQGGPPLTPNNLALVKGSPYARCK